MIPISAKEFLTKHYAQNKEATQYLSKAEALSKIFRLKQAKRKGLTCDNCDNSPIWIIGSFCVGWKGCFSCITGETDSSADYEVE